MSATVTFFILKCHNCSRNPHALFPDPERSVTAFHENTWPWTYIRHLFCLRVGRHANLYIFHQFFPVPLRYLFREERRLQMSKMGSFSYCLWHRSCSSISSLIYLVIFCKSSSTKREKKGKKSEKVKQNPLSSESLFFGYDASAQRKVERINTS